MKIFATTEMKSNRFFHCMNAPVAKLLFVTGKRNAYAVEYNLSSLETKFLKGDEALDGVVANVGRDTVVMKSLGELYSEWKSFSVFVEEFFHSFLCKDSSDELVYFVRGIDREDADEILDFQRKIWRLHENTTWEMEFFGHVTSEKWDKTFSSLMNAKALLVNG